jgi:hypothetical protein
VGGHDTPAVVVVVNPGPGVPQPRSEWRASERALQRAKEPRNTGAPLDEHAVKSSSMTFVRTCCRERCHWRSSLLVLYFLSLYGLVVALEMGDLSSAGGRPGDLPRNPLASSGSSRRFSPLPRRLTAWRRPDLALPYMAMILYGSRRVPEADKPMCKEPVTD